MSKATSIVYYFIITAITLWRVRKVLMMEGKEVDQKFDNGAGSLVVDVDDKGGVSLGVEYSKDLDVYGKAKASISLETNIFVIAEQIAKKTEMDWDDKAVAGLEALLGIKKA